MRQGKLQKILNKHKLWMDGENGGECADLSRADVRCTNLGGADLSRANLSHADLSRADVRGSDLSNADLSRADLSRADVRCTNLCGADLSRANLSHANLSGADLSHADLSHADLSHANLCGADLSHANLSGAKGLLSAADFLERYFERTDEGYIAYKIFGEQYEPPKEWEIVPGAILTETVNPDRCTECGSGINVAPLEWVKKEYPDKKPIWKVLIKWKWLPGVIVPYMTDGKIRCEKVQLIGTVECDEDGGGMRK